MGQMRFYAPTPDTLLPHALTQAYLAGIEAIPWHSDNRWIDGVLCIERNVSESGTLHIPWDVPGLGQLVLSTCTLMERSEPYQLLTELARGTLYRARMLVGDLDAAEVSIPASIRDELKQALAAFFRAATIPAEADAEAALTIRLAARVISSLCQDVLLNEIVLQRELRGPMPTLLAGRLTERAMSQSDTPAFLEAFGAASVTFSWRDLQPTDDALQFEAADAQVEWCQRHKLQLLGGPLIQIDRASLPEWLYHSDNRYDAFEEAARRFARAVVRRYDQHVDVWVCAGRLNVPGALGFTEEQRLRLAVSMIEVVRDAAPQTPVVISFDQPWAEYLVSDDYDLSPLHFADALVRAELGVGGIALEMNLGYWPGGCLPRDLLAISRQLDRWSLLGLPLIVYVTMPSGVGPDPLVDSQTQVLHRFTDNSAVPAMDQSLARHLIPLLLTKPSLHAVVWNQWSDAEPHEFPHAGVLDHAGQPKPLLGSLAEIRKTLLT